jgi:hypothetical protein
MSKYFLQTLSRPRILCQLRSLLAGHRCDTARPESVWLAALQTMTHSPAHVRQCARGDARGDYRLCREKNG